MKKPISYYAGTAMMILAVFILGVIYFPYISYSVTPQKQVKPIVKEFSIYIPKINAAAPVIANVDPWNESAYLPALEKGVAQAKGTALPGQKGTIFLFAHSSDVPWHITRYNIAFFRLGELKSGDKVYIYRNGKQYIYTVFDKKTILPNDVSVLENTTKDQLILQTCTPVGTSLFRLLVFAKQTLS